MSVFPYLSLLSPSTTGPLELHPGRMVSHHSHVLTVKKIIREVFQMLRMPVCFGRSFGLQEELTYNIANFYQVASWLLN